MSNPSIIRKLATTAVMALAIHAHAVADGPRDFNDLILRKIKEMPVGGQYAAYRRDAPEDRRFDDLYAAVEALDGAISVGRGGRLRVRPVRAMPGSFCSSATYLLFCEVVAELQREGLVASDARLARELAAIGGKHDVIHGRLDGVGLFGHWNADGPGTAVLFHRLGLGRNFLGFENARPGDFLKIFWNDRIGKGERGHLVVYLGESEAGDGIHVWSSNLNNADGGSGYGTMWVAKSRIRRALFSRLEHPGNLTRWLDFGEAEKSSDYLVGLRVNSSSEAEMRRATGIR